MFLELGFACKGSWDGPTKLSCWYKDNGKEHGNDYIIIGYI